MFSHPLSPASSGEPAPEGQPPASQERPPASSDPMLGLLSRGLEFWLRQQCDAIEQLEIQLAGSASQLLRGRLDGVRLVARRVVFQALHIEHVELQSEPIRVRMGALLRTQMVQLQQPFRIQGQVALSSEGLSDSLSTPSWRSLGDDLAEQLLGLTPLGGLRIQEGRLVLLASGMGSSTPLQRAVTLQAVDGTIEISSEDGETSMRLPMDPGIRIDQAALEGHLLLLQGEARVSP